MKAIAAKEVIAKTIYSFFVLSAFFSLMDVRNLVMRKASITEMKGKKYK